MCPAAASPSSNPIPSPLDDDPTGRGPRLLVLAGLAVIAVGGCFLLWLDVTAKDSSPCSSRTVANGPIAPTERDALSRYVAANPGTDVPAEGWNESEPNRLSQIRGSDQWVVDVNQMSGDQWVVTRIDHCALGGT